MSFKISELSAFSKAKLGTDDDVIAHAEELGQKSGIVEENGWADVQKRPLASGKVSVRKLSGAEKQLGSDVSKEVNKLYCPSYFAREKIDKLFN